MHPDMGPDSPFHNAFSACVDGREAHVKSWFEMSKKTLLALLTLIRACVVGEFGTVPVQKKQLLEKIPRTLSLRGMQ